MQLTYSSYLKLDELLHLQQPVSEGPEHDETLFIIIHQVYELWFKEVIHEVDYLRKLLVETNTPLALATFKRILTILKVLVSQIDVLETITPLDFLSFRDRLESGSGFQSYQFRELEFLLGRRDRAAIQHFPVDSVGRQTLETRYRQGTLWDAFLRYVADSGYAIPAELLERDVTQPVPSSPQVQGILTSIYRGNPTIVPVCERLVDLDEGLQEWRYRHVKMVERTIGTKPGTGGSAGAEYLKTTLMKPVFPDLWAIRGDL